MNNCYSPTIPLYHRNTFPRIIAIMLSVLARILFIMAYGVLGLDRLHNCLRLHDTGFVMLRLRFFCSSIIRIALPLLLSSTAMLSCHRFFYNE